MQTHHFTEIREEEGEEEPHSFSPAILLQNGIVSYRSFHSLPPLRHPESDLSSVSVSLTTL